MKQQKYLILLLFIVISGCASVPQTTRLPQAEAPSLEDGWGRVYVTAGISNGIQLWSKHQVGPFLINDKEVGSTAKGEYLLVDLRPGTYKATCTQHEPFNTTNLPVELQINAGEQRYFACDMAFADEMDSLAEELILPGGVRGFMSIASGTVSFLKERPIDLYDSKLSFYTKFTEASDSLQSVSLDQEIQKDSSSVSTEKVDGNRNISGTYISDITSNKRDFFGNTDGKLEFTLEQNGDRITAVNSTHNLKVMGTRKGNIIEFGVVPHRMNSFQDQNGVWEINPDGINITGSWKVKNWRRFGQWNLKRIE